MLRRTWCGAEGGAAEGSRGARGGQGRVPADLSPVPACALAAPAAPLRVLGLWSPGVRRCAAGGPHSVMSDYHTVYRQRGPRETTVWEDSQRALGNLPPLPKEEAPDKWAPGDEPQRGAQRLADMPEQELEVRQRAASSACRVLAIPSIVKTLISDASHLASTRAPDARRWGRATTSWPMTRPWRSCGGGGWRSCARRLRGPGALARWCPSVRPTTFARSPRPATVTGRLRSVAAW